MTKHISRRQILMALAAAAGKLGLGTLIGCAPKAVGLAYDEPEAGAYLPMVSNGSTPTPSPRPPSEPRVVHVHSEDATSWDFSTGWYGDYVNQAVVDEMMEEGLKELTGQATVAAAWQMLLPGYTPGRAIAIKVNLNNSGNTGDCFDDDNSIDALIEPVNAAIRGMKDMGVQEDDIWIYDASRPVPNRFSSRCLYPDVRFFGTMGCGTYPGFSSDAPNSEITFAHPSLTPRRVTDVLVNATYLVNMPILKDHGYAPVTLGFKNHFGTIDRISMGGDDNLHLYIQPYSDLFSPSYNPLLDIYLNPHIRDKTVLVLGDGLYGGLGYPNTKDVQPSEWSTFDDDAPNSLFFAADPVAIDCVMFDILDAEPVDHPRWGASDDSYLALAADAGLGVYERGDPWGDGYGQIDYLRIGL